MKSLLKTRRSSRFCGIAGYGIHNPRRPSTWVGDVTLNWNVADHPFVYSVASLTSGAKNCQVHHQRWASARRKNRDECGGNWFILILKDHFFYYAAVLMRMCKLCSSVKISRLDNNWGFCDVYVYKKSPRLFVEGHQNMANFSLFPLYTATVGHWSASRGSDSFVLLLLSLPACLLHTLPVTIK